MLVTTNWTNKQSEWEIFSQFSKHLAELSKEHRDIDVAFKVLDISESLLELLGLLQEKKYL